MEPIAILAANGLEQLAAILGTLKAGKIYSALDISAPPGRISAVLENLQPGLLLFDPSQLALAKELTSSGPELLDLAGLLNAGPGRQPLIEMDAGNPAALFYTSGTTGLPKGVSRSHAQITHYAWINASEYAITPEDRHSALSSMAFARGGTDLFQSLLNGASLHFFSPREHSLDQLAEWLAGERISILSIPLSLLRQLAERVDGSLSLPDLRLIILGGQAVYRSDIQKIRERFPGRYALVNRYSSSETGMMAQFILPDDDAWQGEMVPVGYPAHGFEIQILDEGGFPVGAGKAGEMVVRSRYLTPGYWRDPELTRKAFSPDPPDGERRVYRTGDLGRMRLDGLLEHLGRVDLMVKVRGYRVELPAVEAALLALDRVSQAAVLSRPAPGGENQLTAFLVSATQPPAGADELHNDLSKQLPDYMIPSTFVYLESLPVTPSGKVDLQALLRLDPGKPTRLASGAMPRTALEKVLAGIWGEILNLEAVAVDEDFFFLGGHSLLAIRMVAEVNDLFHLNLPLRCIFETRTIAGMAQSIGELCGNPQMLEEAAQLVLKLVESDDPSIPH